MRKYFYCWAGLIVLFALLLRLMVARDLLAEDPQVVEPSVYSDMHTYKKYSEEIVRGEYKGEFYYQPFYYVAFLPLVKGLFGFGPWPLIFVQSLISAATVWLSILVGSMLWGRRAGIISGLLVALSSVMIIYIPYHLLDTLQAFWVILISYTVLKCCSGGYRRGGKLIGWGLAGVFTSLGILTRGNIWFFVPGLALFSIVHAWRRENSRLFRFLPAALYLAMVILPQIPFALKNTVVTGNLSGPSTAAGAVLALGNTPEAPPGGREAGMGPGPMEYPETYSYWMSTEGAVPVWRRMLVWAMREPAAFFELQWRKLLLFWDRREIPNNIAIEHQGLMSPLLHIFGLIPRGHLQVRGGEMPVIAMNIVPPSIILLVLGLSGVLNSVVACLVCSMGCLRRKAASGMDGYSRIFPSVGLREQVLLYMVLSYCAGTVAFYILARFRIPVLPLLAVFAGGFSTRAIGLFSKRALSLRMLLVFLISVFVVNFGYDYYRYGLESGVMRHVRPHGVYSQLGAEVLLKDNGPYTFGSWEPLELREGVALEKMFNLPGAARQLGVDGKISIELIWAVAGELVLEVDGRRYDLREPSPIRKKYEFAVGLASPVSVLIKPLRVDARVYVAVDRQRNYSRTLVGGEAYHGELVCDLYIAR